ncbi:MAG: DNA polymerase III subunit beta [Oscillospiraceae bacterium]
MKFNCNRQILSEALMNISKAVSTKSTLPVLEGILIKCYNNKISLYGYNLELLISTNIETEIITEGEIVINAKILTDIVKKMDGDNITISKNENNLCTIKSNITEFNIMSHSTSDYPEIPSFEGDLITSLDNKTFKNMIEETIFSVSTNDQKPVHTGVLFDIDNNNINLIAVDGFRLALRKENIINSIDIQFIVPSKTLSEISKLIKEDDENIEIFKKDKNIIFKIYNYIIISRLLEGDFLDYKNIINSENKTIVNCERKKFFDMIDRTSLIINDRVKSPVITSFTANKVKTHCVTSIGEIYDEIDCDINGEDVKIGFNNKYFLDALRVCKDENIKILLNGPLYPIKITPIEDDGYLFLILPVRLKDE